MDLTEDLSARVLLKHILSTEEPKTPITRSAARAQSSSSSSRRTGRSRNDAGAQTPQNILRRSLKNKMQESITRKSLPAASRRRTVPASLLLDDAETPRHILKNILLTEPVKSPVVHEAAASEEPQPPPSSSSITRKRPSSELSGLDLPDLTIGTVVSAEKGLSRKRARRSLNVTAFEKRLKDGDDVETETEESRVEHSSLSLSSSTSLSLKTPFVEVQTERRGLQRRVSNRRKITVEEFGAAVDNRHNQAENTLPERGLSETAFTEGFTLGLSKLSEPDITTDIVHCNTALYAQSDGLASNFSMVATQDKPTILASQLQRRISEMEEEKGQVWKEKSAGAFTTEEVNVPEHTNEGWLFNLDEDVNESQNQKTANTADDPKDTTSTSKSEEDVAEIHPSGRQDASESEEVEVGLEAQTVEESLRSGEDALTRSQSEELKTSISKDGENDSQTEEENEMGSLPNEMDVVTASSDSEEKEVASDLEAARSQTTHHRTFNYEEVVEAASQSGEEEEKDEIECKTKDGQSGDQELDDEQESEPLRRSLNHINRQAHRSEGGFISAVADAGGVLADAREAGWSKGNSNAQSAYELSSGLEMANSSSKPHAEIPDLATSTSVQRQEDDSFTAAETDADKENVYQQEEMHDNGESVHLSDASSVGAHEQEDEDGEEEFPCKTPAFVREKRDFFQTEPVASTSLQNVQASTTSKVSPAAKPKQSRSRKGGPAKKEPGLSKSYLMGVFKHFAKTKVSADVYPVLKEIMDKFFDRLAEDLETYAHHAKRTTIEFEDALLLLKRQGYVNDKVPVEALIEKYLRMDQRRLLIPIATSGNVVIPNKR